MVELTQQRARGRRERHAPQSALVFCAMGTVQYQDLKEMQVMGVFGHGRV